MPDDVTVSDDILSMLDATPVELEVTPPATPEPVIAAADAGAGFDSQPPTEVAIVDPAVPAVGGAPVLPVEVPITPVVVEPTIEEVLRAEIARLSGLVTSGQLNTGLQQTYPPVTPGVPPVPVAAPVVSTVVSDPLQALKDVITQGFLTADELDSVIDKPELLNEAYKRSSAKFVENIFNALPQLVSQTVATEIQKTKLVSTFYEMYGDLKPYGDFVRLNMAEIEKVNPTKTYKDIFEETATVCRKRLGLKEPSVTPAGVQPDGKLLPPAFAGAKGGSGKSGGVPKNKELFDSHAADVLGI
jgi:hypothetical protein